MLNSGVMSIVLIIITTTLIILLQLRQIADTRAAVLTQNLSKTLELSIEGFIDKSAVGIQAIADDIREQPKVNVLLIDKYMEKQKQRLPEVDYFYGVNERGDVIYGGKDTMLDKPINVADRQHFIRLRDTKNPDLIDITTPLISRTTNEWIWLISCRVNKSDGSFGGVVSAAIVLDKLNALLANVTLDADDSIALRGSNLDLIARYPAPEIVHLAVGSTKLSQPFIDALKKNPTFGTYISGTTSIDNISRTHSYRKNEKYGFTINVGISTKNTLAEWHKQVWVIISLVTIFIASLLFFLRMMKQAWSQQERNVALLNASKKFLQEASKIARLGNYAYDVNQGSWTSSDILDTILGIDKTYLRNCETWLALVSDDLRDEMQMYLFTVIEQNLTFDKEYRIVRINDGQERWVHGKGQLQFDEQGNLLSLIGTIQDITERKLAEIEIKLLNANLEERVQQRTAELEMANQSLIIAKNAAEKANVAKSTFIATMSHELRTPLNAVLGFSELMSLDENATAKQKETLNIINSSGAHLLAMINNVLDISKIEAGKLELDNQVFDLVQLLNDVSMMIRIRAEKKQLDFHSEISPNIAQFISADRGKLRQILINLLGNAIKFTADGSVILRAKTENSILTIDVIDSGVGIPADKQHELFKPFVQVTQANHDTQGNGLGLAISKSLVKLMAGKISVSSELGEGSTFKIELPITLANSDEIAEESHLIVKSLAENQLAWRLLVVDDNADNRLLLTSVLISVGFDVHEADDGQEAIHEFETWQPHLIWMDMRMPVLDGYEATMKIRQLANGDKVKIIALTASAFTEQHQRILDAGCDAILHKPFHVAEILAALTKHLGVEFSYREPTPESLSQLEITKEMLRNLPLELRQFLHEAALQLDTEETESVIAQIKSPEIANGLNALVKNFQFEQIILLTDDNDEG
jgi:PAS domain S-box-containing protein